MDTIISLRPLLVISVIGCAILLPGCVISPYAQPAPMTFDGGVQGAPVMLPPDVYPAAVEEPQMNNFVYSTAPVLISPVIVEGYGWGYWYNQHFWPYYPGCAFYGGRYYGGYESNYWRPGCGSWHGGNYHYYANRYRSHADYSRTMWSGNNSRSVQNGPHGGVDRNRHYYKDVNQRFEGNAHRHQNSFVTTPPPQTPQFQVPNIPNGSLQPNPGQHGGGSRVPTYGHGPQNVHQSHPYKAPDKKEEKPRQ